MNTLTAVPSEVPRAEPGRRAQPHQGMPPLDLDGSPLSFFEFWPMWAFYPPVAIYAAWLMLRHRGALLPTVANPSFPAGGLVGESKSQILEMAVRHAGDAVAPFVAIDRPTLTEQALQGSTVDDEVHAALARLRSAGLELPVVAKPDLGCRGVGVKLIRSEEQLRRYLDAFPRGARLILQRFVDFEGGHAGLDPVGDARASGCTKNQVRARFADRGDHVLVEVAVMGRAAFLVAYMKVEH